MFEPFLHKRVEFESEREVRAFFQDLPAGGAGRSLWIHWDEQNERLVEHSSSENHEPYVVPRPDEAGRLVEVDLQELIQEIVVAPGTPEWLFDLVSSLARDFDLSDRVRSSQMSSCPSYQAYDRASRRILGP